MTPIRKVHAATTLALTIAFAPTALAWNDTGHMVVALIAYDGLAPEQQSLAATLLRAHPRFTADFAPNLPRGLRNRSAAEQNRWYFAFAATWPDIARRFDSVEPADERSALVERYNHPSWHYINLPTYLRPTDAARLGLDSPPLRSPGAAPQNLVQALAEMSHEFCRDDAPDAERALALSWVLHLIGDLHQPLHTTALYAVGRFEDGDRGGNDIAVGGSTSLHALWDGALGNDRRWRRITTMAAQYRTASADDATDSYSDWAAQSRDLAARVVYSEAVRRAIEASPPHLPVRVDLDSAYRSRMYATAQSQIALAGHRTARVVAQLLDADPAKRCRRMLAF